MVSTSARTVAASEYRFSPVSVSANSTRKLLFCGCSGPKTRRPVPNVERCNFSASVGGSLNQRINHAVAHIACAEGVPVGSKRRQLICGWGHDLHREM